MNIAGIGRPLAPIISKTVDLTNPRREMHPAALEAASNYSAALDENEALRARCQLLQNDLDVANRSLASAERICKDERLEKERYMRYAVEVKTHLEGIALAIESARQKSFDAAKDIAKAPQIAEEQKSSLEDEIAGVIKPNIEREKRTNGNNG